MKENEGSDKERQGKSLGIVASGDAERLIRE